MLSSYNTVKPCQKCLIHPTGFGVKWAVRGTNFCNVHGGQLPEITKLAEQAVKEGRDRLVIPNEIQYDGDMAKEPRTDQISLIERIETKIEEVREGIAPDSGKPMTPEEFEDYRFGQGYLQGLEQALEIVKDA